MYFLVAALCALVGTIPLLVGRKLKAVVPMFFGGLLFSWCSFYFGVPGFIYPFFGAAGLVVLILWVIAAIVDGVIEDKPTIATVFPAVLIVLYIGSFIFGSEIFRAKDYANLINPLEKRVWTADIQPKDPKHMAMVSVENAIYVAKKVIGEAGSIGSQFHLATEHPTPQMLNGELWYVIPLDYTEFFVWNSANGVPGYIKVHAEDVNRKPELVQLPDGQKLRYTPGAYLGDYLERHIRSNGYMHSGLTDYSFEIDDASQKPHWVVTTFEPTIVWNGEKVTRILIIDPVSGTITPHALTAVPHWVDRVVPASYVKNYLSNWGYLSHGWWNTFLGGKLELTEPEEPNLIYGSDNEPYFVTGITSRSKKDDSLIGLVYTHTRTGKSVLYETKGGATDDAVLDAVNKNNEVQMRKMHGTYPQLYNVHGVMTSVVPLLNESHSFQGVAMVNIKNIQMVAVGKDQHDAVRIYQKLLAQAGHRVALDNGRAEEVIIGSVDRINQEVVGNSTVYYLHLKDIPHLFTGGSEISSKLPVTQVGDRTTITFVNGGQDVLPMERFDNLSLVLAKTADQVNVEERSIARKDQAEKVVERDTILENVKAMSPEQLIELYQKSKQ